jgi:flagellar assembly protein FliH
MVEASLEEEQLYVDDVSVLTDMSAAHVIQSRREEHKGGYQKGYEAGWQAGQQKAALDAENLNHFAHIVEEINQERQRLQQEMEGIVMTLALAVAERIVKRELRFDESIVLEQIKEAVRRVIGVERVKIRVHPDDEQTIREHRPELLMVADSVREVIIEPDPKIERGGCILESDSGNIDARLATQLEALETALMKQVG